MTEILKMCGEILNGIFGYGVGMEIAGYRPFGWLISCLLLSSLGGGLFGGGEIGNLMTGVAVKNNRNSRVKFVVRKK